jgi:CRISPR-associated protein Cmr4
MFQIAKPLFFICETPLHAGAGGGIGTELPIQREEHTQFPKIEASGIKGALREVFEQKNPTEGGLTPDLKALFGHPTKGDENAGALGLTDGRLLLFPVRSRQGIFAWATCGRVLTRFARDLQVSKANQGEQGVTGLLDLVEKLLAENKTTVPFHSIIAKNSTADKAVWLEEYYIKVEESEAACNFALALANTLGIQELPQHFVVIPDDYFADFVQHCTEMHTRIRIGENGVVEDGALFTEEHLPAESVLYSLVLVQPELTKGKKARPANEIFDIFKRGLPDIVQIGGNATLGKGIIRTVKTYF